MSTGIVVALSFGAGACFGAALAVVIMVAAFFKLVAAYNKAKSKEADGSDPMPNNPFSH